MDPITTKTAAPAPLSGDEAIRRCLVEHAGTLKKHAFLLIHRSGLAAGEAARELAKDILQDLALQALQSAGRLDCKRPTLSWLKGIMSNLLKQRRAETIQLAQRQVRPGSEQEDEEMFDWLASRAGLVQQPDAEMALGGEQRVNEWLASLESADREIIQINILCELDGEETARRLGIAPGAARQRLRRALGRLRKLCPGGAS